MRLDQQLRALFPGTSRRTLKQWLERGRVCVDGRIVRRGDVAVTPGDRVELGTPQASFPPLLRLVFEDDEILVIDKPAGLLTIATERERERTAYRLLAEYVGAHGGSAKAARRGGPRLFIVHRLDRETSGLLVFAKSPLAKRRLQSQFEARNVERRYVAVVEGVVSDSEGTLRTRLRESRALKVHRTRNRSEGREAITDYRVIGRRPATTLLELSLVTGRRGQIRAQLAELGHPIVGDRASGARHDPVRRLCLHATRLGFAHPHGQRVVFESPAPPVFARVSRDMGGLIHLHGGPEMAPKPPDARSAPTRPWRSAKDSERLRGSGPDKTPPTLGARRRGRGAPRNPPLPKSGLRRRSRR